MNTGMNAGSSVPLGDIIIDSVIPRRVLEEYAKKIKDEAIKATPIITFKLKLIEMRFGSMEWYELMKVPIKNV